MLSSVESSRELQIKRLRYRSWHRGCKETDLILGNFSDTHLHTLDDESLNLFEALLDEEDTDIWSWLIEKEKSHNPSYEPLLERLRHWRDA